LEVKRSKFSLPEEAMTDVEALVIEEEEDHLVIEEDSKIDPTITEIDLPEEISVISPEDASTAVRKDT
jgi:hypothetical protein